MKKNIFNGYKIYLLICVFLTLLSMIIGHGEITLLKIILFFISLAFTPLIPYITILLAINTFKDFRWWKILILICLVILMGILLYKVFETFSPICFKDDNPISCQKVL